MIVINVAVGHGLIRLILGLFIFADSIVLAIIVIKVLGARKKDADPFAKESSERLEGVDAGGETSDLPELFLPVAPKKAVNPEPKRLSARSLLLDLIQKRKSLAEVTQAVKQARQEEFVDENTTESEAPAPKMKQVPLTPIQDKSKGGSGAVLFLLIFAVPWCGITGLFTVFAIKPLWDRSVAAETYVEGSGVVQESRVDSHRGDESTQYKAVIRYSYEVKGKPYLSDRVSFGSGGSSSDSSGAHKTQRKYPKGAKVKLWYDPNEPSEAVLEIGSTGMSWFLLIFMQPFWMVAAGLIIGITLSFLSSNPVKRFFETDLSAFLGESLEGTLANRGFANGLNGQVRIPGWGTLAVTPEGHHLNRTRNYKKLLYAMAIGYGISFFFSIFIIAFFKPGGAGPDNCTSDTFFWILQNVTLPVMVVAVVLYLRKRSKNSAKKIDVLPRMRQIIINGTAWSYDDIQQLHLKQMRYAKGVEVNGSNVRGWSVGVMLPAGLEEPLIFLSTGQGESDEQKIVARMAHYFSQLLEKELVQCQGR